MNVSVPVIEKMTESLKSLCLEILPRFMYGVAVTVAVVVRVTVDVTVTVIVTLTVIEKMTEP